MLISPVWLWYCLRSGSFWFFSSSNPTITFGGFEGEGKREMYDLLPPGTYPKTAYAHPGMDFAEVKRLLEDHRFSYPFVVKPDVGMKGLLFRKIDNEQELQAYHRQIPFEYVLQDLIDFPLEVSVFYYRYPDQERGVISGFIQKDPMYIRGDGQRSVWQLISVHSKAKHRLEEMRIKHGPHLEKIIPEGERYLLTYAANLNRGATFSNLHHLIDDDLLGVFDALSHPARFYYGRYDLKCRSIEDLKKGQHFLIIEFNGSGAEPNHVYHSGYSLIDANREFLKHWKALYKISKYNHEHGVPYWPFKKGWDFIKYSRAHLQLLERYDKEILI
jgi:hypothetical protein